MAAFAQRGLPAFSMYGHDVQDINDNSIPDDVAEKMVRWAKGTIAVGQMKDKAYVNLNLPDDVHEKLDKRTYPKKKFTVRMHGRHSVQKILRRQIMRLVKSMDLCTDKEMLYLKKALFN